MAKQENNDGFMSRWSKRKQAVAAGEEVVDINPAMAEVTPNDVPAEINEERAAELEANKLAAEAIDIDQLDYNSDFSAFLKEGVPSLLRQKAMRILWRSNPVLANVDGLCDYDDNFADPSLILKKFESAYRIGKGYLFEENEEESEEELETAEASDENIEENAQAAEADTEQNETVATPDEQLEESADTLLAAESPSPIEEVPLERPRVSLRQRLQFET